MNPNAASGNPSDWAFWSILAPNGRGYIAFAPLTGEFSEPQGAATTMIRVAAQGLLEYSEWVYEVPKKWNLGDVINRLLVFGFKQDEKGAHLLNYFLEIGSFEPDDEGEI